MSFTYINELIDESFSPIASNQNTVTAGQKPHLDHFQQQATNAVNNGLDPEYVFKLTMFMCTLVKCGLSPEALQNKLNDILSYMQQHELELTDKYINDVIEFVNKVN
jgi:hypothetical protein